MCVELYEKERKIAKKVTDSWSTDLYRKGHGLSGSFTTCIRANKFFPRMLTSWVSKDANFYVDSENINLPLVTKSTYCIRSYS
jgi:hypothetical protein